MSTLYLRNPSSGATLVLTRPEPAPDPDPSGVAALSLESAVAMTDGRVLRLEFAAPADALPDEHDMPDWRPGDLEGLSVALPGSPALEFLGAWVETSLQPPLGIDHNIGGGGSTFPPGTYYGAGALVSDATGLVVSTTGITRFTVDPGGETPGVDGLGGARIPAGYTARFYLTPPGGAPSTLRRYVTVPAGETRLFLRTNAAWEAPDEPFPSMPVLKWKAHYLLPDAAPVAYAAGATVAVSGPAGLLRDRHGNATAAFSTAATNLSLVDATGFTDPDIPLGTGGYTLYVSMTHGDDSYGLSRPARLAHCKDRVDRPLKTLAEVAEIFRTQSAYAKGIHVLLLRETHAYSSTVAGGSIIIAGTDHRHPVIVGPYWHDYAGTGQPDPGTRPVLICNTSAPLGVGHDSSKYPGPADYLLIRGIHFLSTAEDPGWGLGVATTPRGLTFDDCVFENLSNGLQIEPPLDTTISRDYAEDCTLLRCVSKDIWSDDGGHVQGSFFRFCRNLLISQCTYDHAGRITMEVPGSDRSHALYIQSDNRPIVLWGSFLREGSSHGIQARPGGVLAYNVFSSLGIGSFLAGVGGWHRRNVTERSRDIGLIAGGAQARAYGHEIIAAASRGQVVEEGVFVNTTGAGTAQYAVAWTQDGEVGDYTVVLRNNTVYRAGRALFLSATPQPTGPVGSRLAGGYNVLDGGPSYAVYLIYTPVEWSWYEQDHNLLYSTRSASDAFQSGTFAAWKAYSGGDAASVFADPAPADPTADLGDFHATLGGPGDVASYVTLLRDRPARTWGGAYRTPLIFDYYAAAYAPTATAGDGDGPFEHYGAHDYRGG